MNSQRHRRLRSSSVVRSLVRETHLNKSDLIYPLLVTESGEQRKPVRSMPGIDQVPLNLLREEVDDVVRLGIEAVLVFGIPNEKDEQGSQAYHDHGIAQEAIREIKRHFPELVVIADTCLCEYTSHGHCGIVEGEKIANDLSLNFLAGPL